MLTGGKKLGGGALGGAPTAILGGGLPSEPGSIVEVGKFRKTAIFFSKN